MLALCLSWSTSTNMNSSIKTTLRAITPPQRATLRGANPDSVPRSTAFRRVHVACPAGACRHLGCPSMHKIHALDPDWMRLRTLRNEKVTRSTHGCAQHLST